MPRLIDEPAVIVAEGAPAKRIEEFIGQVNTGHGQVSVARLVSPGGWTEPAQCPEFMEISVVLRGLLWVWHERGHTEVSAGQALITQPGERVRYETPDADGAEYIAVCLPAFSPATVQQEE